MTAWCAIDIGTNSVKVLVARVDGASVTPLLHDVRVTQMGVGLQATGRVSDEGMRRTLAELSSLMIKARALGPSCVAVVGMEAFRRASNARELCRAIRVETGLEVRVLSGREEACLNREGVQHVRGGDRPCLVVDIGGGSTELALSEPEWETSLALGAVTASEGWLVSDPPRDDEVAALREHVLEQVAAAYEGCPIGEPAPALVGVGGTVTTCASIDLGLPWDQPGGVHGHVMNREKVAHLARWLSSLPLSQRRSVRGLHPKRAPAIVGGVLLLETIMTVCGGVEVQVSEADLLYGVVKHMAHGAWNPVTPFSKGT